MQYTYSYTSLIHVPILKPIGDEELRALSLVSAMLKVEYAMQYTYSYTSLIQIPILKPIGDENSERRLSFLLRLQSNVISSTTFPFSGKIDNFLSQ